MVDGQASGLSAAPAAARWPGFSIANEGAWYQLRCDNCGKATSPASLEERLIDAMVRDHRCGPPLSTHWSEGVSTGAGYAVMLNSFAMLVEQMAFGLGAEPDVSDALDRLSEAALSHRRGAADVVERYDHHEGSLYTEVPQRPVYVPPAVPVEALTTLGVGFDDLQGSYDLDAGQALVDDESSGPVYVTVRSLLASGLVPSQRDTGEMALGVVWAPGTMCMRHLVAQVSDGRLAEELGLDEGGVVVYPGDQAPPCAECQAEAAAEAEVIANIGPTNAAILAGHEPGGEPS